MRCQWKDNCKLRFFEYLHYFTLPNYSVVVLKTYCTTIEHEVQKVQCKHNYIKLQVKNIVVYVNKQLSESYLSYSVKQCSSYFQ